MENETFNISGTQSPINNPFSAGNVSSHASLKNMSFKDIGGPPLTALNDEDFLTRESLGILPSTTLFRDSLTSDFFSNSNKEPMMLSPRESLGILNISAMDLGRESIGIFNINNPMFKREFSNNEWKEDLVFNDFQNTIISPLHRENPIPQILLSNIEDKISSLTDFNKGFLLPHSRKISGISSGSSAVSANPSFNSRSLEEPSKISSISSVPKDVDQSFNSAMATTDPLNEAFQFSLTNINSVSCKSGSTHYSFASDLENIRNRIQSLPLTLENNKVLGDIAIVNRTENVSFDEELICRGIEGEKDLDDSVFLQDRKHDDTSFHCEEKSFDGERYLLDSTPQPEWGEWDSSKSIIDDKDKSLTYSKVGVSKKIDKMLGMQPVSLEEKLKSKNVSKCNSTSSVNMSQNISKVSRASQCSLPENQSYTSNNFSQDLSKISNISEENVSKLIKNLSDIIDGKLNLSKSQKNDGHHMLQRLTGLLCDSGNKTANSEDSGHSSVEDPQLGEKQEKAECDEVGDVKVYEALDLSCKNSKVNKSLSRSKSPTVRNPPPYVVFSPNHAMLTNASTDSTGAHTSDRNSKLGTSSQGNGGNHSNASAKNQSTSSIISLRRHSSITHNRVSLGTQKFKKAKTGIVPSKKEPLRAVLPVENMAKNTRSIGKVTHLPVTPERTYEDNKQLTLKSKKTSTPLQEPKLKPMAASTPASRQSKDSKENSISNAPKPKMSRSFSHQPRASTALDQPLSSRKSGESNISKNTARRSMSKVEGTKFVRRNSVTESPLKYEKDTEGSGSPRLKRSFSAGKESKILSALSKVRQNILNSPYYNPRKSTESVIDKHTGVGGQEVKLGTDLKRCSLELKSLSKISQSRKIGKENLKP